MTPKIPYMDYDQEENPSLITVEQILACGVVDIPECLQPHLTFEIYRTTEELLNTGTAHTDQLPYLIEYCYGVGCERVAWMGIAHELGHCLIKHLQLSIPPYEKGPWIPFDIVYLDDKPICFSWRLAPSTRSENNVLLLHEALAWAIGAKLYKHNDWDCHEVKIALDSYREGVLETEEERDLWIVENSLVKCW